MQHRSRVANSTAFGVRGHALESSCSKQAPGMLKASILTSAALFWRAPEQNGPGRLIASVLTSAAMLWGVPGAKQPREAKSNDFVVGDLALECPWAK